MRLEADGTLRLSPTDLGNHLACAHLTQLELRVQRGELARPHVKDAYGEIIMAKGNEHERAYLERLEAGGARVARMLTYDDEAFDAEQARRDTEDAIRAGEAEIVYQAYLSDGVWRGFADFLERQPDGTYEPVDTKLARSAKPLHLLQLCFYAEQLGRIQGRLPEHVHVELGTGERETFRTAEFIAFFRRSRERFLEALDGTAGDSPLRGQSPTYPWPCSHCGICDFRHLCRQQLEDDDHLVLVAGLGRLYAERLQAAGIPTLTALGEIDADDATRRRPHPSRDVREAPRPGRAPARLRAVRRAPRQPPPGRGGPRLPVAPAPSPGDVWLDLEGHPFYEPARGLEYLFGYCYRDEAGELRYEPVWGLDREGEKAAFERFVDWLVARRLRYPDLHVYHYAAYERTALRRLMGEHSVREAEIDDWLRQEVLVDLYRVVRQSLRAGVPSYSIKEIEKLYGFERTAEVSGGDESVVLFEQWLESGDDAILEGIRAYNEEDCRSTVALHEWLLGLRPPDLPWRAPPDERPQTEEAEERDAERIALHESLLDGEEEGSVRWLLAHLVYYHRRESKSQWWEWFHHLGLDEDELIEDDDTMGGLKLVGEPVEDGQSLVYTFEFPPQEHKIDGPCVDPATGKGYRVRSDDELGLVSLKRSKERAEEPLPRALIPSPPIPDWRHRDAIARFARAYRDLKSRDSPLRGQSPRPGRWWMCSSGGCRGHGSTSPCRRPRSRSTGATSSCRDRPGRGRPGRARRLRRAAEGGPAGRRHLAQPQGDREAARRDRAGGARAGLPLPRAEEVVHGRRGLALRGRLRRLLATTGETCSTRSSSSSRARRGSSSTPSSKASWTR